MEILLEHFNAKLIRSDVFKPTTGNKSRAVMPVNMGLAPASCICVFVLAFKKYGWARCIDIWMYVYRYVDTGALPV
jgi:hypothetical protein